MPLDLNTLMPWFQLGVLVANRHYEATSTPITKEEAEAELQKEYRENVGDIAGWFASKGLPAPK
jgi:hypothetical protein